jgi:uncharacterized protein (DUF1778 family)
MKHLNQLKAHDLKLKQQILQRNMTSFIMASAFEKAEAVIESHRRIEVSEEAFNRVQQILLEDETAAPSEALLRLMRGNHENRRDAGM